jgi:hypothetical protein
MALTMLKPIRSKGKCCWSTAWSPMSSVNCRLMSNPLVELERGLAHSSAMLRALQHLPVDVLVHVKQTARFTTHRGDTWLLRQVVKRGESNRMHGWLFGHDHAVKGTILLTWMAGQAEPWCLFTNQPHLGAAQYGLHWWQEASFKDLKSGGW